MVNGVDVAGDEDEEKLYKHISRCMLAPQGIGILNSDGLVLEWVQMFDNNKSVLDFLEHSLKRFGEHPNAKDDFSAECYLKFPSEKIKDFKDDEELQISKLSHEGKKCPANRASKSAGPKGSIVAELIGRALDENGKLHPDTVKQEHYSQDYIVVPPDIQKTLLNILDNAETEIIRLPEEFGMLFATYAHLGNIDVRPLLESNKGKVKQCRFLAREISEENGETLYRVVGKTEVTSELNTNATGIHEVSLKWKGFIKVGETSITNITFYGYGREKIKWGLDIVDDGNEVKHLPVGRSLNIDCDVRYGVIGEPISDDKAIDTANYFFTDLLRGKIERLQRGIQRWQNEGRDPTSVMKLVQKFESLIKDGAPNSKEGISEMNAVLDEALGLLEKG